MVPELRYPRFTVLLVLVAIWLPGSAAALVPAKLLEPHSPYSEPWEFGFSVASAGDWNGDGYQDLIVGLEDGEGTGTGHAALYLGGPLATKVFHRLFHGENVGDRFGNAVSSAGDFNGDGYDDVVIGAPYYDTNEPDAGAFYVFYGGPGQGANGDATYDLKVARNVTPGYPGVVLGYSVVGMGDQNADGFDDILVGAPDAGPGGIGLGEARLYFGGPMFDETNYVSLKGLPLNDFGGFSVGAADVNRDGFLDPILGSPILAGDPAYSGRAYVFLGGPILDLNPDFQLFGESSGDRFGFSVSGAGDLNSDGYEDVVIGAPENVAGGVGTGRSYVYWGGSSMTSPSLIFTGGAGDHLGWAVSTAGNLDGDLDDELLLGSWNGGYIYFGGPTIDTNADIVVPGARGVARVGDFNGDGLDDFVVGDPIYSGSTGRATVYAGKSFDVKLPKPGQQVYMGSQLMVEWAGQEKADGYMSTDGGATWTLALADIGGDDRNRAAFSVPAVQTDHARVRIVATGQLPSLLNSDESGEFRIVRRTVPPSPVTWKRWSSPGLASERRGWSSASAGDWNVDGYDDVIVGAPLHDALGASTGRAYVYFGGPAGDGVADRTLTGQAAGDLFGYSVAGIGDMNMDGLDDVAVGAPFRSGFTGAVYVIFGGPAGDTTPDLVIAGVQAAEGFGTSVAPAGDLNGDRYPDFAVGSPSFDDAAQGLTDCGIVRVYFGGPLLDGVADLSVRGSLAFEGFGTAIAGRGDLSGDGFDDLLVGAPLANASTGRAAAIFGGPELDEVADGGYAGGATGEEFGASVAIAGDVNGDGVADAVIGAPHRDGDRGRAVVHISPGPPDTGISPGPPETETNPGPPDLRGEAAGDMLGASVAGVGDVNGDGFADIAAGAPRNGSGGERAGRVYVVLGTPQLEMQSDVAITGTAHDEVGRSIASLPPHRCCGYGAVIAGGDQGSMTPSQSGVIRAYDFARFRLIYPTGGESWPVGALRDVLWQGSQLADLELSVDGGATWTTLAERCGGRDVNQVSVRVPHAPTKFAMLRINPGPPEINPGPPNGAAVSDSFFTIQTSVALLALLAAPAPEGHGVVISWKSDPGPEDLAGYRLESETGAGAWRTLASLTRETTFTDHAAGPATRYRLFAVNGLGEELLLGETALLARRTLAAWPAPYRGGNLTVSFATASGMGGAAATADVALYDVHGRRVRTIERGKFSAGHRTAVWDGRDDEGRDVGAGVYFLRVRSAGQEETMKLSVLR